MCLKHAYDATNPEPARTITLTTRTIPQSFTETKKPPHPPDEEALHSTVVHPPMPDINVRRVIRNVNGSSERPHRARSRFLKSGMLSSSLRTPDLSVLYPSGVGIMPVAVLVTDFSITPEAFQIDVPDHGFKELMRRCVQGAVEIVKEVNTISWQNEDQPDHADGKRQRDSAGEHS